MQLETSEMRSGALKKCSREFQFSYDAVHIEKFEDLQYREGAHSFFEEFIETVIFSRKGDPTYTIAVLECGKMQIRMKIRFQMVVVVDGNWQR